MTYAKKCTVLRLGLFPVCYRSCFHYIFHICLCFHFCLFLLNTLTQTLSSWPGRCYGVGQVTVVPALAGVLEAQNEI